MEEKLYSIADIALELQLSKPYIYRKLNDYTKELKKYTKKLKGVTYLSVDGFNLLKEKLTDKEDKESDPQQQLITTLQEEVKYLREQLQAKDDLIEKHISMLQEQTELVKREQQLRMTESKNILLLQQHIGEVDQKLTAWRENSTATKEEKVSFFKKFWR